MEQMNLCLFHNIILLKINNTCNALVIIFSFFQSCSNLHPENKWNLLEMNIQNDSIEHQLSLKNLTENNAGYYKCSAYNNVIQVYKLVIECK